MFTVKLPKHVKAGETAKGEIKLDNDYLDKEFEKSLTIEVSDANKTHFTIPVKRTLRVPGSESDATAASTPAKTTAKSTH